MKLTRRLTTLTGATALAMSAIATPMAAQAESSFTGNIGVYSAYVLRGITNAASYGFENDGAAVQGGFDWSGDSGVYVGYWGSSLSYTSDPIIPTYNDDGVQTGTVDGCLNSDDCPAVGFENDIYAGYAGTAGDFDYDAGLIYYYYIGVMEANGLEVKLSGTWKGATLGVNYLTNDVAWGNSGDMYWTLGYDFSLPKDFTLGATLGYYIYEKSGKYVAPSRQDPDNAAATLDAKSSAFRHLTLSLSHPIASSGFDMSLDWIIGGEDRYGISQPMTFVLGVSSGFDI